MFPGDAEKKQKLSPNTPAPSSPLSCSGGSYMLWVSATNHITHIHTHNHPCHTTRCPFSSTEPVAANPRCTPSRTSPPRRWTTRTRRRGCCWPSWWGGTPAHRCMRKVDKVPEVHKPHALYKLHKPRSLRGCVAHAPKNKFSGVAKKQTTN